MLASWRAQSIPLPLWLSISYATDALQVAGVRLLSGFRAAKGVEFVILQNKTAKAQFQHYAVLVARFRNKFGADPMTARRTWLLFSDDDDTWHAERARVYQHRLDTLGETQRFAEVIIERQSPGSREQRSEQKLADVHINLLPEYHACAVRMSALAAFVDASRPLLLSCRYADLFFVRYLMTPGKERIMGNAAVQMAVSLASAPVHEEVMACRPGLRLLFDMEPSEPLYRYDGALTEVGRAMHNSDSVGQARESPWEHEASQLFKKVRARGTDMTSSEALTCIRLQMTSLACLALASYHPDPDPAKWLPAEMPFEWICAFELRQGNNQEILFGQGFGNKAMFTGRSAMEMRFMRDLFDRLMTEDPEWVAFRTAPTWPVLSIRMQKKPATK